MKKKKIMSALIALSVSFSLVMAGCKNDDDDDKNTSPAGTSEISDAQLELNSAALSVIRGLCAVETDDDLDATNSEEEKGNGIEVFPDDWQSRIFAPDQGFVLDENEPGVRSMPCAGADEARDYVSSLIGETIETNSCSWTMPGLGKLVFTVADNAETEGTELYATLDVQIPVIPELTQLRFVPVTVVENASAENGFSGKPYFPAGSLIKRLKDDTLWLCVRPSGGTMWKKNSGYWICIHGQDKNMNFVIKGEEKSMLTQTDSTQTTKEKWNFAKGLMSEKTAKAAIHTLNCLTRTDINRVNAVSNTSLKNAREIHQKLTEKGYNLMGLWKKATVAETGQIDLRGFENDKSPFYIAYGSAKKDSKRITGTGSKANATNNIVQPYLRCSISTGASGSYVFRERMETCYSGNTKNFLYSATDSHDLKFLTTVKNKFPEELEGWNGEFFNNKKYTYLVRVQASVQDNAVGFYDYVTEEELPIDKNIIFSPELKLKDNKGEDVNPLSHTQYQVIYRPTTAVFDFWETLDKFELTVNGKNVEWKKVTS